MVSREAKMAAPLSRVLRALLLPSPPRGVPGRGLSDSAAAGSRWKLFGALCLQRPPLLSQALSPEEAEMTELMQQLEVERSLYSVFETRCFAEKERLRKIAEKGYDDEDDKGTLRKKVMMVQDLEDMWEQKFQTFKPASRITDADEKNDRTSLNRNLDQNLLLLVKQKLGDQMIWLLPQAEWEAGETLRDTAERALWTLSGNSLQAKFLGNAPCGFYKYKLPKAFRAEGISGAKVFFFKALLQDLRSPWTKEKVDYMWVSKGELADYLTPKYYSQVTRFLVDV